MQSQTDRAIELVLGGMYQAQAARLCGISQSAVCHAIRRRGLVAPVKQQGGTPPTKETRAKIASTRAARSMSFTFPLCKSIHDEWKALGSYSAVAERYGFTRNQVASYIRRYREISDRMNGAALGAGVQERR